MMPAFSPAGLLLRGFFVYCGVVVVFNAKRAKDCTSAKPASWAAAASAVYSSGVNVSVISMVCDTLVAVVWV